MFRLVPLTSFSTLEYTGTAKYSRKRKHHALLRPGSMCYSHEESGSTLAFGISSQQAISHQITILGTIPRTPAGDEALFLSVATDKAFLDITFQDSHIFLLLGSIKNLALGQAETDC